MNEKHCNQSININEFTTLHSHSNHTFVLAAITFFFPKIFFFDYACFFSLSFRDIRFYTSLTLEGGLQKV
jgi:hypothetical protein